MAREEVDTKGTPGAPGQKRTLGQRWHSFMRGLWNPDKKEVFGRGGCSWAKIGLFYLIFYSCLAGFFAIMLTIFFQTVDDYKPTMTDMYSLIKMNPGMGFRPKHHYESTLIRFRAGLDPKEGNYETLINDMTKFLKDSKYLEEDGSIAEEELDKKRFSIEEAIQPGRCPLDDFGYRNGTPCVILKLNRVIGWKPAFNESQWNNQSKWYVEAKAALRERGPNSNFTGVSCEGENDGDIDNMGPVEFYPNLGFSTLFYPYAEKDFTYRPPIVFAKFLKPHRGVIMQIWCKAWAENIKHHKNDKGGSTHFELFIDGKLTHDEIGHN